MFSVNLKNLIDDKKNLFRINSVIIRKEKNSIFLRFDTQVIWEELYLILKHYAEKTDWFLKNFEFMLFTTTLKTSIKKVKPNDLNISTFEFFHIDISKIANLQFFNGNQLNQQSCLGIKINYNVIPPNDFIEENEIHFLFSKLYKERGSLNTNKTENYVKLYRYFGNKI